MNAEELEVLLEIKAGTDFEHLSALEFEDIVCAKLRACGFTVERQVWVDDRGDGRRGKIDLIATLDDKSIPIEIDRKRPRAKSLFKVRSVSDNGFILTRSPFSVIKA